MRSRTERRLQPAGHTENDTQPQVVRPSLPTKVGAPLLESIVPSPLGTAEKQNSVLRQWTGPLSQDLLLHPGEFGLGKVPARLRGDIRRLIDQDVRRAGD